MKKSRLALVALLMLSLVFISCSGQNGIAYQKYYWGGAPLYFFDTNPYTPSTVYNDEYFYTGAGSYYMEYIAWNGSKWYLYYTIEIDKGKILRDGDDFYYEIDLYSTGPSLYRYRVTKEIKEETIEETQDNRNNIIKESGTLGLKQGPIIGKEERELSNGKVTIEYGKLY